MRFPRSLQWRITLVYTGLIVLTLGVASFYLVTFIRSAHETNLETRLQHEARLIAEASAPFFLAESDTGALQAASERMGDDISARVTLIALDGTTLADSWGDPAQMANQADLPEVERALSAGLGVSRRRNATAGEELIHVAVPVIAGDETLGVARVALPMAQAQADINRSMSIIALIGLTGAALAVLLGFSVASRTSRSIGALAEGARQITAGDFDYRVQAQGSDETQELAQAFNRMAMSLRDLVRDYSVERGKLTAVLNTMADGVVVIDGNGTIVLVNPAAEEILNLADGDMPGRRFTEIIRDHNLQQLVARCTERREVQHGEVEIPQWRRYLSVITTPLEEHGNSSVLLTMHDLTRIRQVETTRKEFVSNVSHELRGPLAAVKILAESLASGALKEKKRAKDFLRRINSEIDRMTAMVNELMELSRLESEQASLQLVPLDLQPLIAELDEEHRERSEKRKIVLDVTLPQQLPRVRGDEEKLRQVLDNLLNNAVAFTPEDGRISLSAQQENGTVCLRVADTGVGIPRKHLPHIFERFYKVDRSRQSEGFGLGLAIVKHIVQAHGGEIHAESVEGQGTTFTVVLPAVTEQSTT
ncbi:MAG: ATP-binding protein [Chloroflexi bacterium]|nr:ATP-binding protein [Chloroflexota bacterium]